MAARSFAPQEATPLLRNRLFCRLWAAQFSAGTTIYALSLAGAVLVERQTHSSTQTSLVILSSILPAFLASLVAGAVVDRWGRVPVLLVSHLARALVGLAFWAGTRFLPPTLALAVVYIANVAVAAFSQFALPAELALLPDLVDRPRLTTANALLQFGMLAAEGLGIVALSPLVIKIAGPPAMGVIGAGLCLAAAALVVALPRQPSAARREPAKGHFLADLQAGWRTIARDRLLSLVVLQATLTATLLLVLLSLVPGLVSRHLELGVEDAPFLILPGGLGFALGSLLIGRLERWLSRPAWIATGLTGLGTSIGLLSALAGEAGAGRLWLLLPLILGIGLALALVIIPARTILQERPPAALRGRVIAAQLALANAAAVIPLLLGGALADHLGIRPVMALLGVLAVGAGAVGLHQMRT